MEFSVEKIFEWTYPGAAFFHRDCDLGPGVLERYEPGMILRNGYFLDLSALSGGLLFNTRFLIASSKAARLYLLNPDNARFGHSCINANSFFKVLDRYTLGEKTQVLLLHIPSCGVPFYAKSVTEMDTALVELARQQFDNLSAKDPLPDLHELFWLHRTHFPVGMDAEGRFFPMDALTALPPGGEDLYRGIVEITKDDSGINAPMVFEQRR